MSQQELDELHTSEDLKNEAVHETDKEEKKVFRRQIVWFNALGFLAFHLAAVYGSYLMVTSAKLLTIVWMSTIMVAGAEGVTMGAHRLYTHRTMKATTTVRVILTTLQTIAGQNCMYIWVRDHRQHHKYSDTDADPHNSKRGFFFSHVGWLMCRKHPDVIEKGKTIDMSDIEADPIVMFQKKYYKTLYAVIGVAMPVLVPYYLWGETLSNSFFICLIVRECISLNLTWLVNSYAHMYGTRPFSKDIEPVESDLVSFFGLGEGWHNYHHTFPWDYRAAEYGQYYNVTTTIIDFLAKHGWLYDLKSATPEMVARRIYNCGDGTHSRLKTKIQQEEEEENKQLVDDDTDNEKQRKFVQKVLTNGHTRTKFVDSVKNDTNLENLYKEINSLPKPIRTHGS